MTSERVSASDRIAPEQGGDMKTEKPVCLPRQYLLPPMAEYILRRRAAQAGIPRETNSARPPRPATMRRTWMRPAAQTIKIMQKHGNDPAGFTSRKIRRTNAPTHDHSHARTEGKNTTRKLKEQYWKPNQGKYSLTWPDTRKRLRPCPGSVVYGDFEETLVWWCGCRALLEKISK